MQGCDLFLSGVVTTLVGNSTPAFVDGTGTDASLNFPNQLSNDGSKLFIGDATNSRLRQVDLSSRAVTLLAGSGVATYADGTGAAAAFNAPRGVSTDGTSLFVADSANNRIRRIIIGSGVVTTLAGSGTATFADGVGVAAAFSNPFSVAVDGDTLFVADTSNHRIRMIQISTANVTTIAGSGTPAFADGTGTLAAFSSPSGIATDGTNLYVSDATNNRIRQIVIATGVVTTLAGNGTAGWTDGNGATASFNGPNQLVVDKSYLYVGDTTNSVVRRVTIRTGWVETLVGRGASGFQDGTGSLAFFNFPRGVTSDGRVLLIADNGNHRIRHLR